MSQYDSQFSLSPNQQDLLVAALGSNQPSGLNKASANNMGLKPSAKEMDGHVPEKQNGYQNSTNDYFNTSAQTTETPSQFLEVDDSPYLGYDLDADGDDQFDFDSNGRFIGDYPGEGSQGGSNDLHEKRKSIDGNEDDDEGGGKRRESEGGTGKKPGRKPLTAEPTSVSHTVRNIWLFLTVSRSAKHKTGLPNELSANARRDI